jgi:hypothetical protein
VRTDTLTMRRKISPDYPHAWLNGPDFSAVIALRCISYEQV